MLTTLTRRHAPLPRETRDTLFLLAVIAWVVLPQVQRLPLWCSLLTAGILMWRGALAWRAKPLPSVWWIVGMVGVMLALTLHSHQTLLGRDAGVTMIVVLIALKTLELRAKRDAFVVFFLGFFAMLTNFFFSQSLLVAGAMVVGLLGLLTAVVNAHMPVGRPPLWHSARLAGSMALLGAPVMVALFLLFPRIGPLWGIPTDGGVGRSGLSSTMEVGSLAALVLDERIAMRVRFEGEAPPRETMYYRGPVLSLMEGREWRPLPMPMGARGAALAPPPLQPQGPPVRYEVTLEPSNRPWLMTLDLTPEPPQLGAGMRANLSREAQWVIDRPVTDLLRYQAVAYPRASMGPGQFRQLAAPYLDLPPGLNPRTHELAAQLTAELRARGDLDMRDRAQVSAALVNAVIQRLRSGGYSYTLAPGEYGLHTADEFWFDKRTGFCEHIASAFVVLLRAAGVPSRVVTGYQGGERNDIDGFWVVRQSDAHAWTEVWMGERGWVRVDPTGAVAPDRVGTTRRLTPPQGVLAQALSAMTPTALAQMRAAWEAVNNAWNQWVLNYTQSKQLDLLKNLGFQSPSWEDLSHLLLGLLSGAALLGAAWTLWERRQHDPWIRSVDLARKRLLALGLPLPAQAGPRQMAQAAQARWGPEAQALAEWLLRLEAHRYAPSPSPTRLQALLRDGKALRWPQGHTARP